jgi:hypothetical protein
MPRIPLRPLLVTLALLSLSCASSAELARRSAVALQGGDSHKAYEWAKRAVDKDPSNAQARAALYESVQLLARESKTQIWELAQSDTIAAAERSLEFGEFRYEAARYRAPVDPDSSYATFERALQGAAGRIWFERGEQSATSGRPKRAYGEFLESSRYDARRPGLERALHDSFEAGVTRVAILPVRNDTGKPGLTRDLSAMWYDRLSDRLRAKEFRFTRLVSPLDVRAAVDRQWHIGRDDAIRIGRRLGAQQVLWSRVGNLESDTHTNTFHDFIYRKVSVRDTSGGWTTSFVAVPFEAVTRERMVSVSVEMELIDVAEGRGLFGEAGTREHRARTAYTSFVADGSCDDYVLAPPRGAPDVDFDHAQGAERRWKGDMPDDVALPAFLERARRERGRSQYRPEYRDWFFPSGPSWVFLDDLPPANDLAFAALAGEWQPAYDALKRLEPLDAADVDPFGNAP